MLIKQNDADILIELLINSFSDSIAFVSDAIEEKVLICNSATLNLFHFSIIGLTLSDIMSLPLPPLLLAELKFCQYVQSESITTRKMTLAIEQFNGAQYVTMRKSINYRGKKCILTLIVKSNAKAGLNQMYFV